MSAFFLLDSRLNPLFLSTLYACYMPAHTIHFELIITITACLVQIKIYEAAHIVILFNLLSDSYGLLIPPAFTGQSSAVYFILSGWHIS